MVVPCLPLWIKGEAMIFYRRREAGPKATWENTNVMQQDKPILDAKIICSEYGLELTKNPRRWDPDYESMDIRWRALLKWLSRMATTWVYRKDIDKADAFSLVVQAKIVATPKKRKEKRIKTATKWTSITTHIDKEVLNPILRPNASSEIDQGCSDTLEELAMVAWAEWYLAQ